MQWNHSMTASAGAARSKSTFLDVPSARLVAPRTTVAHKPPGPDPLLIGKRIRHRRKALQLTLDAVAEQVGLSPSAVSLIETGKREAKVSTVVALASVLGCEVSDLLSGAAPSRRADLELRLERAQTSPSFAALGVPPVRTGPRLPLDALESLVALHERSAEVGAAREATPQ
jgi:transcriptional regulator with XRE-family HTH domain